MTGRGKKLEAEYTFTDTSLRGRDPVLAIAETRKELTRQLALEGVPRNKVRHSYRILHVGDGERLALVLCAEASL